MILTVIPEYLKVPVFVTRDDYLKTAFGIGMKNKWSNNHDCILTLIYMHAKFQSFLLLHY